MTQTPAPQWFSSLIARGLQRCLLLSLDRTPASELLPGTAEAWVDALWPNRDWHDSDAGRITEAFRRMTTTLRAWPTPSEFLAALPARTGSGLAQLPERVFTNEERAANLAKLQRMLEEAGIVSPAGA